MVYGSPPSDASALNDSTRIERERKPYVAQPGGGKIHDISSNVPTSTRGRASSINQGSRDADFGERHTRAQSNASNASNPAYIPSQRSAGGRRPSSPPLQKFSSSVPSNIDGPNITYIAPSFSTAAQNYTPVSQPIEMRDRDWDYRDRDVRDRDRDEDLRRYGKDGRRNTMDDSRTNELNNLRDSRRSTFDDARTADTMSQRDVDRWDRGQEGRGAEQRNSRDHDDYYRGNGRWKRVKWICLVKCFPAFVFDFSTMSYVCGGRTGLIRISKMIPAKRCTFRISFFPHRKPALRYQVKREFYQVFVIVFLVYRSLVSTRHNRYWATIGLLQFNLASVCLMFKSIPLLNIHWMKIEYATANGRA